MLKKILIGLTALGLAGLLIASSASAGPLGAPKRPGAPAIALVNEDEPATFNGMEYLLGREFVTLVSNDDRYNWQVVSRSVAEKAYSDEAVSAVIVLPTSFSHDILTLEDINPVKAVVEYRVAPGDQLSRERLQNEVSTILRDFNARVVQTYFASVAANIAQAQVSMETVVGRYTKLVDTLANDVQPRLTATGEGYTRSESIARILQSMNTAWIQAQNGFTSTTARSLTSIGDALAAQEPKLSDYFSLQEQLTTTNLLNGNAALSDQATSDGDFYRQAFADHIGVLRSGDGSWSGFAGLASADAAGEQTGALVGLQKAVAGYETLTDDYNSSVQEITTSLTEQAARLDASSRELGGLAGRLLDEYFGITLPADSAAVGLPDGTAGIDGSNAGAVDLSDPALGDPRAALAQKIADSFSAGSSTSSTVSAYETQLAQLVAGIATDPAMYEGLFDTLESTTDFDRAPFESRLALIKRYADANNIDAPALTAVSSTHAATQQTVTKTLPVTVPAGESQRVEVHLPSSLQPSDATVAVESPTGAQPGAGQTSVDPATGAATIDNSQGADALTVVLRYTVDLHDLAGDALVEYTATTTEPTSPTPVVRSLGSDRYVLMPASAAAGSVTDSFSGLTSYLGDITTAATLLRFLYGAPGESEDAFTSALIADGEFREHSDASVYKRYGVVDAATIETQLSDADVAAYRQLGIDNVQAILTQIGTITTAQEELRRDIASLTELHLDRSHFTDALQQLEAWYAAAITSVNAAPDLWAAKSNTVIQLATTPWDGQAPGRSELYLDDTTGPALYKTLTQLVDTSSRTAKAVTASARLIDDNSTQFDDLIAGVRRTESETDTLLATMNGTIAADSEGAAESSVFSSRFSTVLSNTRANGADPAKIYDTFANPVTAKDSTPPGKANRDNGFDYRWLAVFVAGSLVGAVVAGFAGRRKRRTSATSSAES